MKTTRPHKIRLDKTNKERNKNNFTDITKPWIGGEIKVADIKPTIPIIIFIITVLYFALLSFYTNYRGIDYFDFITSTGNYVWIMAVIFIIAILYFSIIFYYPLAITKELHIKHNISYLYLFVINTIPSVIFVNIYIFDILNNSIYFGMTLIFIPLLFVSYIVARIARVFDYFYILSIFVNIFIGIFAILAIYAIVLIVKNLAHLPSYPEEETTLLIVASEFIYILIELSLLRAINNSKIKFILPSMFFATLLLSFIYPGGVAIGDAALRFLGAGGNIPMQIVGKAAPFCSKDLIKFVKDKALCTKNGETEISTVPVNVLLISRTAIYFVDSNGVQPRVGKKTTRPIVISRRIVSAILPVEAKATP